MKKTPVILDTDIGGDIDDTWALVMMLQSPELDIRLITTSIGDTTYKAKIVGKMLEIAGRTDIPIGIGIKAENTEGHIYPQAAWIEGYDLNKYPGKIYADGVEAIVETIMSAEEKISVVVIGPLTNIAKALDIEPSIVLKSRFVGMFGSIYKGYDGTDAISQECNVVSAVEDCKKVFSSDWDITITPVDTCGIVILKDEKYQKVAECKNILVKALIENYKIWLGNDDIWIGNDDRKKYESRSTTLYDTVAIYLAIAEDFLEMKDIGIRISDDGYTLPDKTAKKIRCAISWKNLEGFEDFLVGRLIGE